MTANAKTEEQMVHLVRNALLVAGQEMGNGDQWPVIKDTVYRVMKDWENLKVERNVQSELKKHVYEQLNEMDRIYMTCTPEERAEAGPLLKQLREIYDAYFAPVDNSQLTLSDEDTPIHVKRAEHLISSLEEEHVE
ncbi:MAG: hypothetical protein WCD70_10890 [Alphaproteobacteria bacterium]